MMSYRRSSIVLLSVLASLLISSSASAVTFSLIGTSGVDPRYAVPGDTITLDIRVDADGDSIMGLAASVYGYDESVVDFQSGEAVGSIFNSVAIVGVGVFGGLVNLAAGPLAESAIGGNGNRVLMFNGVGIGSVGAQPLDPGLDGIIGGGDAQFRLTFLAVGPGITTLRVGTGYVGDAVVLGDGGAFVDANGFELDVCVCGPLPPIPEPGTALLIGLGLAGLAAQGRLGCAA